jgi:hypothetical protein
VVAASGPGREPNAVSTIRASTAARQHWEMNVMSWTCYEGHPIEFHATYDGVVVKVDGGPGTNPVYGLKVTNVSSLTPNKVHIGRGFYVQPDLPHGITHHGAAASYDLELIVTGPELPAGGQRVTFQWGLSPCLPQPSTTNMKCKQFLNVETVQSSSGPYSYVTQFVSGYSEQQYTEGSNDAMWRVCYDGPFETVVTAPFPDHWQLARVPLWIDLLLARIAECGEAPACDCAVRPSVHAVESVAARVLELPVPRGQERLRYDVIVSLHDTRRELTEAEDLLRRSNADTSEPERRTLRQEATIHLQRAREQNRHAMGLLARLEDALTHERDSGVAAEPGNTAGPLSP